MINYNYQKLQTDVKRLKKDFPFLEIGNIGKSVLGKNISYIKIGKGEKEIFYSGAYHANEWITSPLLVKFANEYGSRYVKKAKLINYDIQQLYKTVSLYIVPMVNPDGVDLVNYEENEEELFTCLAKNVDNSFWNSKQIAKYFPDIPYTSGWKANIDGIDLNLQFPTGWENARKIKFAQGFDKPAPRDYVGRYPLEAKEAKCIYDFTNAHKFELIIAYHTQGKEIYWEYQNYAPEHSKIIGEKFSKISGYKLANVPYNSSFAGYKDWFIEKFHKPGFTIEAGIGENPLQMNQFDEIWKDNFGIMSLGIEEISKII